MARTLSFISGYAMQSLTMLGLVAVGHNNVLKNKTKYKNEKKIALQSGII